MEFKIKIDLSSQSIINESPAGNQKKKKRPSSSGEGKSKTHKKSKKEEVKIEINEKSQEQSDKKKKKSSGKKTKKVEEEKPRINSNSIISLTLPNNDSSKGDQAQKLSMLAKKKPRHWEKRWVLIPNVFEFTKEIWLKKWVLVDGGDDITDNNNYLQQYYSSHIKPFKEVKPKKYNCSFDECGKIFFDASSLRKHLLSHGERHVNIFYNLISIFANMKVAAKNSLITPNFADINLCIQGKNLSNVNCAKRNFLLILI